MDSETRVILSTPIQYGGADGKMRDGTFVTLRAPSSSAFKVAAKIKQQMMRAIMAERRKLGPEASVPEPADSAPAAEPERAAGPDMLAMLAQSDADLAELGELVRELILSHGIALVDGEVKMTALLVDRLSLRDFEAIVGEYLATFPLA